MLQNPEVLKNTNYALCFEVVNLETYLLQLGCSESTLVSCNSWYNRLEKKEWSGNSSAYSREVVAIAAEILEMEPHLKEYFGKGCYYTIDKAIELAEDLFHNCITVSLNAKRRVRPHRGTGRLIEK